MDSANPKKRIAFKEGNLAFNCRVVGVAVDDGYVLLHRSEQDDFWTLPGGGAELLEPATQTVAREMREELGVEVQVERLIWLVENFFTYQGLRYHELALYFLVRIPLGSPLLDKSRPFEGHEEELGLRLIFRWFPLEELAGLNLLPTFLRTALRQLPETTTHVVHTDPDE